MKYKKNKGFTLAEMLIAVAIIGVLMAVSFIAVQNYQRSLHQLEYDGIAKEIFIAAQNHLTMADSQGLVGQRSNSGTGPVTTTARKSGGESTIVTSVYYYCIPTANPNDDVSVLNLMLPTFSIDETVRAGSYFILYQKSSATVLDVFFSPSTGRYHHDYNTDSFETLMGLRGEERGNKMARRDYGNDHSILGWYGGGEGLDRVWFDMPSLRVENEEKLKVIVTNPGSNLKDGVKDKLDLKLTVTGKTSEKTKSIMILKNGAVTVDYSSFNIVDLSEDKKTEFEIVLDDITKPDGTSHFAELFSELYPGEDLEISVEASSSSALSNIAKFGPKTTNSLFADPDDGSDVVNGIMGIRNIRHLENLDGSVSDYDPSKIKTASAKPKAVQLENLSWTDFQSKINGSTSSAVGVNYGAENTIVGGKGYFYPISPNYALDYEGKNNEIVHKIQNVDINFTGNAGLFGTLEATSSVKNLELIDFSVIGTTNAGALIGSASNIQIENVLAHHSNIANAYNKVSVSSSGNTGGLIGEMSGGTVEKCGAALVVSGSTNAGGLIGKSSGGNVTACYSGGHTISGVPSGAKAKYDGGHGGIYPVRYDTTTYNVTGGTTAGGLIGNAGSTTVSSSYSTCSVSGTTAGGFVGTGGSMSNCYCTGLVSGTTVGAFTGAASASATGCQYFEIINERKDTATGGYTYLGPTSGTGASGITALDADANAYNLFSGSGWSSAESYDAMLRTYYQNKYNLKTVVQLGASVSNSDFVATHYGDWPAPEEFVFN